MDVDFEDLVKEFLLPVYRYIFIRVRQRETSEDLSQVVFLKAFKSSEKHPERKLELSYFFTIARNTLIDHWRKKKLEQVALDDALSNTLPSSEKPPGEVLDTSLAMTQVMGQLDTLPEEYRQALTLRFISNWTTEEIAQHLGTTPANIRQLQCRGLNKLRKLLEGHRAL